MDKKSAKRQRMMDTKSMVNGELDITGETVQIKVGHDSKSKLFHVHENALKKSSSAFFQTALKGEWKERRGDNQPIRLEHHDPSAFERYIKWLYSGAINPNPPEWTWLIRAYGFGEEILDREFQNAIITILLKPLKIPDFSLIKIAYDMSPEGSPLRKLMVDQWAKQEPNYIKKNLNDKYDHKFVADLVIAMAERSSVTQRRYVNPNLENVEEYLHKDLGMDT